MLVFKFELQTFELEFSNKISCVFAMYSHVLMLALLMKWFNFTFSINVSELFCFSYRRQCIQIQEDHLLVITSFLVLPSIVGNRKSSKSSLDLPHKQCIKLQKIGHVSSNGVATRTYRQTKYYTLAENQTSIAHLLSSKSHILANGFTVCLT